MHIQYSNRKLLRKAGELFMKFYMHDIRNICNAWFLDIRISTCLGTKISSIWYVHTRVTFMLLSFVINDLLMKAF